MNRGIWKEAVDYPGVYARPIRRNAGDNRWMRRKVEGKSLYVLDMFRYPSLESESTLEVSNGPTSRSHDIPYVKYTRITCGDMRVNIVRRAV